MAADRRAKNDKVSKIGVDPAAGKTVRPGADVSPAEAPSRLRGMVDALWGLFGIRVAPAMLGLAFAHCWLFSMQRTVSEQTPPLFQPMLFFGIVAACAALAAVARVSGRNVSTRVGVLLAATVVGVAATAVLVSGALGESDAAVEVALAFVCGCAIGTLYLAWGDFHASLDIRQAVPVLFGSLIVGSLFKIAYGLLARGPAEAALFCLLPVLCVASRLYVRGRAPGRLVEEGPFSPHDVSVLRNYALGIAVFGVAIGVTRLVDAEFFALSNAASAAAHLLEVAVGIGMIAVVYRQHTEVEFSNLWTLALVAYATGLVVAEYAGWLGGGFGSAIVTAAQMLVVMFTWLALTDIAQRVCVPSDVVFGFGYPVYMLPMALVSAGLFEHAHTLKHMPLLVVWVLMLSVYLFMRKRALGGPALFAGLVISADADEVELTTSLDRLARRYGLSDREVEVVELYAQGRSRAFIGNKLFISENTVRDHISRVYKKLHIHDKQSLIDAIERA